ncbi:MAG: sodium:solute symporter family transporter, partial [Burkholderiaceae bacterium]
MPLASAHGSILGGALYVAGIAEGTPKLFSIALGIVDAQWFTHAAWPGAGEVTSMAAQTGALFVTVGAGDGDRLRRWKPGEGWSDKGTVPGTVIEGSARPVGQAHVLYLVRGTGDAAHMMMFHTITGSWATLGDPEAARARSGAAFGSGIVWAQPAADGAGTEVAFAQIEAGELLVSWFDWFVVALYMASMLGIGLYFYLKEKRLSTAQFFVGGRAIPFWAAGVSLYATNTSSISYIAIPAKAFETNWTYLTNNLVAVMGLVFVAIWVVPLLRRLNLISVFQYLETRFHPAIRMLASALYMLVQIGSRLSVILFLPSLAIATITGVDVVWCIFIMGTITIAYTALGGMKAVIWTDFAQLFVMFGGALFAIGFIVLKLDGGVPELLAVSASEGKMKLLDWSFDLTQATVWGFIFLVLFDVVLTFPKDQVLMQRTLSTRSAKEASRSVWTFAAIMIPGGFLFYFIGTALY